MSLLSQTWSSFYQHSYAESINLLYSCLSFDLLDVDTAIPFFSTVPKEHLNKISTLRLSGIIAPEFDGLDPIMSLNVLSSDEFVPAWTTLCHTLRRMEGLKKLSLSIHEDYFDLDWNRVILKTLNHIKVSKPNYVIEVLVRDDESDDHFSFEDWDTDQAPFTVTKTIIRDYSNIHLDAAHYAGTGRRRRKALCKRVFLSPIYIVFICGRLVIEGCKGMKRRRHS